MSRSLARKPRRARVRSSAFSSRDACHRSSALKPRWTWSTRWVGSHMCRIRSIATGLTFVPSASSSSLTESTSSRCTTHGASPRPMRRLHASLRSSTRPPPQDPTRTRSTSWDEPGWRSRATRARRTSWASSDMPDTSSRRAAAQAAVPDKQLLVAGSVALDTRDGPFGKVQATLGGSAVYFALAASLIVPVKVVAPVGTDGAKRIAQAFSGRAIDIELLQILDAPTYRWRAHQEHGRNVDLGSSDNIYDSWTPAVPAAFGGSAFGASIRPHPHPQPRYI